MPIERSPFATISGRQRKGIHYFFMHELKQFTFNSCSFMNYTPMLQQRHVCAGVMRGVNIQRPSPKSFIRTSFFHKQSSKSPVCLHRAFIYLSRILKLFFPICSVSLVIFIVHLRALQYFSPIRFSSISLHSAFRIEYPLVREQQIKWTIIGFVCEKVR